MSLKNHSSPCIVWHEHKIKRRDREKLKNQKGCVLWLTGLSGCGKSTIANILEEVLNSEGRHTYLLDGDNIRHGLSRGLGFSEEDRLENIKRVAESAKLFVDAGIIVIASFISPLRKQRTAAKEIIGTDDFIEIFIDTPFHECVKRDAKGWYKKALNGEIENYTGVDAAYEKPINADIYIDTSKTCASDAVGKIVEFLKSVGIILPFNL
ncbi:MAG: adenylyl-sulfate kinase [Deltaproteobacteria bacterium]|jgi:adenylyl-sulfate kinase|nr:adenylyl-sulfate kinase [Deltaproteobacteria bacterium]